MSPRSPPSTPSTLRLTRVPAWYVSIDETDWLHRIPTANVHLCVLAMKLHTGLSKFKTSLSVDRSKERVVSSIRTYIEFLACLFSEFGVALLGVFDQEAFVDHVPGYWNFLQIQSIMDTKYMRSISVLRRTVHGLVEAAMVEIVQQCEDPAFLSTDGI